MKKSTRERINSKLYNFRADICSALSNPKRLQILNILKEGDKSVGAIVNEIDITKANLSKHISVLKKQGLY